MQEPFDAGTVERMLLATRALVGIAASSLAQLPDDLTLPQYRILVLLDGRGRQTMGALAKQLDVNPSTATRACDRLVDKGMVARRADEVDRRTVVVELTARGRKLLDRVMEHRRAQLRRILADMPATAVRELERSLAEFATAAGETAAAAWELGWPVDAGDGG